MKWITFGILCLIIFPGVGYAACTKPEPPEIPDPATAVTPQMVKAQNDVKAFVAQAEEFLKCTRSDSEHDDMVTEMKKTANKFNHAIRDFKARMKS